MLFDVLPNVDKLSVYSKDSAIEPERKEEGEGEEEETAASTRRIPLCVH